jgi:two-component system, cell cycle sensor histidine kinase and response regulator CckA
LNRLYAALSQINHAIIQVHSREELFHEVCHVLVAFGGFRMVWVGWVNPTTQQVEVVGQSGDETGYLERVRVFADDRPEGRGPAGTAIREGRPDVCNDFLNDPRASPWREAASLTGWRAAAGFPIYMNGAVRGGLTVYATEVGFFGAREVGLLEEAAAAISYALDHLEHEKHRCQAEKALLESEERLRFAHKATNDVIWDWDIVNDLQRWNEAGTVVFGWTDIVESPQSAAWWVYRLHPDDRQRVDDGFFAAVEDPSKHHWQGEYRFLKANGEYAQVMDRGYIMRNEQGKAVRMIGAMLDITERKQAEDALRENQAKLETALASMTDAVFISDTDGRFVDFNDAFATFHRFKDKASCAKTLREYPEFIEVFMANGELAPLEKWAVPRALRGETITNAEYSLRRKDTGETWVGSYSFGPIRDKDGMIVGSVVVGRDITEQKRAEEERVKLQEQLNQAQKMEAVGRLAGGVAHDFNNQLGVIIGYAEMALRKIPPSDPLHEDLEEIRKAACRSTETTRQLLAFARKQTASPKVLDLNDSVSGLIKMLGRLIGEDIKLSLRLGNNLWPVRIDPSQIDQILANLAINARDAIDGVGKITIGTANLVLEESCTTEIPDLVPGDYVLLTVSDNGCGMDEKTLKHVFEPFFTTKKVGSGTGLGLATVYGIVRQNDGYIHVSSTLGEGTTFEIYLPCVSSVAIESGSESQTIPKHGNNQRILLVEDEESVLRLGKRMLEALGYRVVTAQAPEVAIQMVEEQGVEIDLLITDVVMPGMNGKELEGRIREIRPDLKCLYMSGYTADVIASRGVLKEGVPFIQKPFSVEALAGKIHELFGG